MSVALVGAFVLGFTAIRWQTVVAATAGAFLVIEIPVLAIPALAVGGFKIAMVRLRSTRNRRVGRAADLADLCDLTAIALTGGLGLAAALEIAASHVGGEIESEVASVLRTARVDGLAAALAVANGGGRRLYRVVGQAAAAGSAMLDPVARLADDLHSELAAGKLAAARRLPVSMLFPLTLLILPGFLLLAIAPALLDAFARFEV